MAAHSPAQFRVYRVQGSGFRVLTGVVALYVLARLGDWAISLPDYTLCDGAVLRDPNFLCVFGDFLDPVFLM